MTAPYKALYRHRAILARTTLVEVRSTYAGSVLGALWVVLGPALLLLIYGFIYAVVLRIRPNGMSVGEYILYVSCGLVPFLSFSAALSAGTQSLIAHRQLLLNTVFPAELIPLRSVLAASANLPAGLAIVLAGTTLFSGLEWTVLGVPFVLLFMLMFTVGICWITSLIALVLRDMQQLLSYLTLFLLCVTPIAYTPEMIPDAFRFISYANPLFYYVSSLQSLIVLGRLPDPLIVVVGAGLGVSLFAVGYRIARQAKQAFYDYV